MKKQTTMGGRGGLPSSALGLRRVLFTCAVVALALGGVATSAHAVSGESLDMEGAFQPSCQELRTETGLAGGDEIFVCDSDGEQCRLFSVTDEGVGLGFCEDSIKSVVPDRGGDVEPNVPIQATTFGAVIGVSGSAGDIFCETFETTTSGGKKTTLSPGRKVCVQVFAGNCTTGACQAGDGSIVVRRDSCDTVAALLAASVTGDPFQNLAWWLFSDLEKTGQKNSEVLSVCPGHAWKFLSLSGSTIVNQIVGDYTADRLLIQTPHYVTISGRRYCKIVAGESPTHTCP
jgi:hypothetical protein